MKNKTMWGIAFVVVVVIVSIILFILVPDKTSGFFAVTYIFSLLAITAFFCSALFLDEMNIDKFPENFSLVSISWKYLLCEAIVSLIFLIFSIPILFFLLAQIVLLSIFIIVVLVVAMRKKYIDVLGDQEEENETVIPFLEMDIDMLIGKAEELAPNIREKVKKELQSIYDDIRFSDPVGNPHTHSNEEDIKHSILLLESEINAIIKNEAKDADDIQQFSVVALALRRQIKERNNLLKLMR